MNSYQIADILHFDKYLFTDTNKSARHYCLVLLPSKIMEYENNLLGAVITSRATKYFALKLVCSKYKCFTRDSYLCLNRRDIQCLEDLSTKDQPVGKLTKDDIIKSYKLLKKIFYCNRNKGMGDIYFIATIIREWKKII